MDDLQCLEYVMLSNMHAMWLCPTMMQEAYAQMPHTEAVRHSPPSWQQSTATCHHLKGMFCADVQLTVSFPIRRGAHRIALHLLPQSGDGSKYSTSKLTQISSLPVISLSWIFCCCGRCSRPWPGALRVHSLQEIVNGSRCIRDACMCVAAVSV